MTSEIVLNAAQERAVNALLDFTRIREPFFALAGYAGTGKTTALQHFVRASNKRIALTAPTNKATKVLEGMAREHELDVPCMTIHKMLGLGLPDDREHRKARQLGRSCITDFEVVVVDEASMVDSNLFSIIEEKILQHAVKVVFVGDPMQLPPVRESHSRAFDVGVGAHLTEIVRQAENSPIIELTEQIRLAMEGAPLPDLSSFHCDGDGVHSVDYATFRAWLLDAFGSRAHESDPDKFRAVAWRNRTVRNINDAVRRLLYGDEVEPFVKGERVLAAQPVRVLEVDGCHRTVMSVDSEAIVARVGESTSNRYPRYRTLDLALDDDDGQRINATVCHPSCTSELKMHLDGLAREARAQRSLWPLFYELKDSFDDIRPCHALTAHRSQGSTYEHVFVDAADILANGNRKEALRCLYVACSRASRNVVLRG